MDMHFEGVIFHTHADELARRLGHDYPPCAVLDVRSDEEFNRGHISGSIRTSPALTSLPAGTDSATEFFILGADPLDQKVRIAAQALRGLGASRVVEVTGGFLEWARQGLPVATERSTG